MVLLTILFGVIGITGFWILILSEKTKECLHITAMVMCYLGLILFGIFLCGHFLPFNIHSKDTSIRTEIRVRTLNGMETERDTVYIFTSKKK
jgi:hypothetical protein